MVYDLVARSRVSYRFSVPVHRWRCFKSCIARASLNR